MKQWAIVRMDQADKRFCKWHESLEEARKEAERLTKKEKASFGVVELVGVCEPKEPPVAWRTM